jgi:ATP-dependent helicase/nuclease subunit B
VYALATEQLLNATVESSRLFYCTQRGDYSECHVPISAEARQRIAQVATAIDDAIANGFLPAAPVAGACALCDYKTICGPYEEQRTKRKPKDRLEALNALRSLP